MAKKKVTDKRNVQFIHPELGQQLVEYYMIRDCLNGERAIKGLNIAAVPVITNSQQIDLTGDFQFSFQLNRAKRYLPQPNEIDKSAENTARYKAYVTRAVFYNATGRTLEGMAGQVFQRDPVMTIPSLLTPLIKNADGTGVSLNQLAMRAVRYVLPYGRAGLLCDYPPTDKPTSKQQLEQGDIQPTISVYAPWDIVNWQTIQRGALQVISLVVLREYVNSASDEFEYRSAEQYRVLALDPVTGVYYQELFTTDDTDYNAGDSAANKKKPSFVSGGRIDVYDSAGKPMTAIPFTFIGSENNDIKVDKPPMFDLASLNIAHYRNSADYEEASFMVGQPTPVLAGLTEEWVKTVLQGVVQLGARAAIPLPVGASATLIQANPNTIPGEAMEKKERQMVALGAKLVQQQTVQRSATETILELSSETSILTNVAKNVSSAIEWALGIAAQFVGASDATVAFELNTQFHLAEMSADDQAKLIAAWQKGAIAFSEMRAALRKAGTATLADDVALATIMKEQAVMSAVGAIADPFEGIAPVAPDPNADPARHAVQPATRGQ